nr:hypothetical protein [Tanacetum cinerariifolium]
LLALISQHQLNRTPYQHHQPLYQQTQFQPQATSYQSSPYGTTYHNSQFVSSGPSSLTHSISYPGTDTSSFVNHNAYMASSSAPQIAYAQLDQQSSEYSPSEAGLVVLFVSSGPSSLTHSISYPGTDTSSLVNHNAYMASSSAPQIAYAPMDQQSLKYSPPEAGFVVPVFQKRDDPIDAINHMMSFLTSVVA